MVKWEKIDPMSGELWDFEKDGAELMGKLVEVRLDVGPNDSNIYTVEQEDGTRRNFWGSTLLDARLKNTELGDTIKVVFLGRETSEKTGREYKNFEVYKRSSEDVTPDEVPAYKEK